MSLFEARDHAEYHDQYDFAELLYDGALRLWERAVPPKSGIILLEKLLQKQITRKLWYFEIQSTKTRLQKNLQSPRHIAARFYV